MIIKSTSYKNLIAIENGHIRNISNMVLRKPFTIRQQRKYIKKNSICIICTYLFLEQKYQWSEKIKAICHPFKNDNIFPKNIKKILFSESDFCDELISPTSYINDRWGKKQFDFVYFTLYSTHGIRNKGLYMLPLIDKVAKELNLKGLVINYIKGQNKYKFKGTIFYEALKKIEKKWGKIKHLKIINENFSGKNVCSIMLSSKFVLYPNTADASPRLLAEAIIRGKPVLVNSSIYGGWKYVNNDNGRFFEAPSIEEYLTGNYNNNYIDIMKKRMKEVLSMNKNKIKSSFYKKFGFKNASIKLAKIINRFSNTSYKAVCYKEWEKNLRYLAKNENWI